MKFVVLTGKEFSHLLNVATALHEEGNLT